MGVFGCAGLECSDCFHASEDVKKFFNPYRRDAEETQRKAIVFIGFLCEISASLRLCGKLLMFLQALRLSRLPRNFTPTH
jgi:hypothetical protein